MAQVGRGENVAGALFACGVARLAPCGVLRAWCSRPRGSDDLDLRASLRRLPEGGSHTLNHDSGRYLGQVESTLTSFGHRRRELLAWLPRFGHLRTLALPAHLTGLNAQLHEWRRTLAASTCNHRRHALTNLVRVLYGRRASFDLLDLVRLAPPPPRARWVDRRHIADVLAEIPAGSVTRSRLELMHRMRPSQIGRLRAEDFRLDEPIPYVAVPRGKGARIAAVPLVPEGVADSAFLDAEVLRTVAPQQRQPGARPRRTARRTDPFTTYQIPQSDATLGAGRRRSKTQRKRCDLAQPPFRWHVRLAVQHIRSRN